MEKRKIEAGTGIHCNGLTLTPVVETSINYRCSGIGDSIIAHKQPLAVIINKAGYKTALRSTGEPVSLEDLAKEFPQLKDYFNSV